MSEQKRDLLIVVCTANICRSPMGGALLQHALAAEGEPLSQLKVVTAGIAAYDGDPPSLNSVKALDKVKIKLDNHKSQSLTDELLDRAFAVFGMTHSHIDAIRAARPDTRARLYLFRDFLPEDESREIPDPYGMDLEQYEITRDSMVEAIPSIIDYLRTNYSYLENKDH